MEAFANTWAEMDPEANMWIEVKDVPRFFHNLKVAAPELRIMSVYDIISVTKLKAPIEGNATDTQDLKQRRCSFVDVFIATSWYGFHVVERANKTAADAVSVWLQMCDERKAKADLAAEASAELAVLRRPSGSSENDDSRDGMGLELVCSMGILKDGSADGDYITIRETASGQPLTYAMLEVDSAKDRLMLAIDSHMATASIGKKVKPGTAIRTVEINALGVPMWSRTTIVTSHEAFTKAAIVLGGMVRLHVAVDVKKDTIYVPNIMDDALLLSMGRTLMSAFYVSNDEADTIDGEIIRDEKCAASIIALEVRTWLQKKKQKATQGGLGVAEHSNVV